MKQSKLLTLSAITVIGLAAVTAPVWAEGVKQIFTDSVIFKKAIDVRDGIKNNKGKVVVNDDLRVKGELIVDESSDVRVSAENIVIDVDTEESSDNSFLESENLQDALDNELAVDLHDVIPNSTWTVENTTNDLTYDGYTAQVSFADTTFTVDEGRFAAAGLVGTGTNLGCNMPSTDITYQLLGENLIYLEWESFGNQQSVVLTVFANDTNTVSVVGTTDETGCNGSGERISTLTKVVE